MIKRFSAILLFMALLGYSFSLSATPAFHNYQATIPPAPLPAFVMDGNHGQPLSLNDFHGHFVLLNLWATWCGLCTKEMPALDALVQQLDPKSINVVALNVNGNGLDNAVNFFRLYSIEHLKIYIDEAGRLPLLLKVHGLPTTLLLDRNGLEIGRFEGAIDWTAPDTLAFLKAQMGP